MIADIHSHSPSSFAVVDISADGIIPDSGVFSIGVHPWDTVNLKVVDSTITNVRNLAGHPRIVAIGEAGFDCSRGGDITTQTEVFLRQYEISETLRKPMILHIVKAFDILIQFRKSASVSQPWIVHGFRGKPELAEQLLKNGLYLSLGENFNSKTAAIIPTDKLIIETDESNLSIHEIAERVAHARAIDSADEILKISAANIKRILGLTEQNRPQSVTFRNDI